MIGSLVVNFFSETIGLALVRMERSEDFPAFVRPRRTIWNPSFFTPFFPFEAFFIFSCFSRNFFKRVFSSAKRFSLPLWCGALRIISSKASILSSGVWAAW